MARAGRFTWMFMCILFFSAFYAVYENVFTLPSIGTENLAQQYMNKTIEYNKTGLTLFIADVGWVMGMMADMVKVMFWPAHIIAQLGIPGSQAIGVFLNLLFWCIELLAALELISGGRRL